VAVAPQTADLNAEVKKNHRLAFPVLTDFDNAFAKSMHMVHRLPEDLIALYKEFGIDVPSGHGTDTWELPLATRMVVDQTGTIVALDTDPDYTIRPEPETLLPVLRDMA
jgi:peroxiredoxin